MSFWSESYMAKRLNYEKLAWDRRPKVSLTQDREFMGKDVASAWLERRERWLSDQAKLRSWKKSPSNKSSRR
jgi:hypothetical protein